MKKLFCFTLLLLGMMTVSAQNQQRAHVSFGDTLNKVLSMGFQYLYPEFLPGTVHFTDNEKTSALLNYNVLSNDIHFIDRADLRRGVVVTEEYMMQVAQSLVLTDVDYVTIGGNNFINTKRGVMYLVANEEVNLLRKDLVKVSSQSNVGAYGMQSQTASIEARAKLSAPETSASEGYEPQIATEYKRTTAFYLYDDKKLVTANFRGFKKVFRDIRAELEGFVNENEIDFEAEQDLVKLLNFCLDKS